MKPSIFVYFGFLTFSGLSLASCIALPVFVSSPDVKFDRIVNSSGRDVSAGLWREGDEVILRGEIEPVPRNKYPVLGHLDIVIVGPDGTTVECVTARPRNRINNIRNPYSAVLANVPIRGSVLRISSHDDNCHQGRR